MAYDPTPIDKGFASTASMGAEGSMGRQGAQPMQKGKPVDNAGPSNERAPYHRNPNVAVDKNFNARNPGVGKKSPDATMQKGRPVPNARPTPGTLPGVTGDFLRASAQTMASTYHLGNKPLPWQNGGGGKKKQP